MDARAAAERVFHEESGRILATLIRICGSFDRAEDAMQQAFAAALAAWTDNGVPANPAAWITTAAHRKLIDQARRERIRREAEGRLAYETATLALPEEPATTMRWPDDRLRLIFTCCHPALNPEAQVALTLRTLGGLSTAEIAKAFLTPEPTLAQRLVRAKRKIQEAKIPYEIPPAERFAERLAAVQAVLYLIFNEGYTASTGDQLVRGELCGEAIRLARIVQQLLPEEPENGGLLALMLLHYARRDARMRDGQLMRLEEQDRNLWKREEIAEGAAVLERALALRRPGPYQIQAAIAAVHAQAGHSEETDWRQIALLYEALMEFQHSAVVTLNHAVAVAMTEGWEEGLRRMEEANGGGELDTYYLFHAARADMLRRMNRREDAHEAYGRALELATNAVEREFLRQRMGELRNDRPGSVESHKRTL
jgi:RNA polymerase sigma-70 factor (ECF subfamily)